MVGLKKYKQLIIALFLLTVFNILIYVNRDNFQYKPYSTYNQLYTNCIDTKCLNKWKASQVQFSKTDLSGAFSISKQRGGIKENDNTHTKLQKIFLLLYVQFYDQLSRPTPEFSSKSALEKYFALQNNHEQLWCGNFGEMFLLFCTANNITCRYIEIFKPSDHHVVNECFVPETNRWILIDLTTNVFGINKNEQSFGLMDIQQKMVPQNFQIGYSDSNSRIQYDASGKRLTALKSYINSADQFYYYYNIDLKKVYTTTDKIKRYFLPSSWYELFSTVRTGNTLFFLKLLVFSLWCINSITLIFRILYDRSKRFA